MKIIDATDLKIGRLASIVAQDALGGEEIAIVNSEKAVISGTKEAVLAKYQQKRKVGSRYNGPFFPKQSDRIVKRTIRGMLPYKETRGREAFSRIKTYIGVPKEFENKETTTVETARIGQVQRKKYIAVGRLANLIGGKR